MGFGNADRQVMEIARRLDAGEAIASLTDIRGTVYARRGLPAGWVEIDSTHLDTPGPLNPPVDPYAMSPEGAKPPASAAATPEPGLNIVRFVRRVRNAD